MSSYSPRYPYSTPGRSSRAQRSGRGYIPDSDTSSDDESSPGYLASPLTSRIKAVKRHDKLQSQHTLFSQTASAGAHPRRPPPIPQDVWARMANNSAPPVTAGASVSHLDRMIPASTSSSRLGLAASSDSEDVRRSARSRKEPTCDCCDGAEHQTPTRFKVRANKKNSKNGKRKEKAQAPPITSMPQVDTDRLQIANGTANAPSFFAPHLDHPDSTSAGPVAGPSFSYSHSRKRQLDTASHSEGKSVMGSDTEAEELDGEEGGLEVEPEDTYVGHEEWDPAHNIKTTTNRQILALSGTFPSPPSSYGSLTNSSEGPLTPYASPSSHQAHTGRRLPSLLEQNGMTCTVDVEPDDELLDMDDFLDDQSFVKAPASRDAFGCLPDIYSDGAREEDDEDDEDDDGDILAKLMQLGKGQQDAVAGAQGGVSEAEVGVKEDAYLDIGLWDDEEMFDIRLGSTDRDAATAGDRRDQALSFLESIPLQILTQLHSSLVHVNAYHAKNLKQVMEPKKKAKMLKDVSSDEEDGGEGPEAVVDWDQIGVNICLMNRRTGNSQVVSFPDDPTLAAGKVTGQRRIACILRVAELLYAAILGGVVSTKRDIYYHDVGLFGNQRVVDALVDDIAATAGLKRQDFSVCATSKGLVVASNLKIRLRNDEDLAISATNASLIPPIERIVNISLATAEKEDCNIVDWVLIVEKDAVFQTLSSAGLMSRADLGNGVMMTGKGYPDLATLQLLSLVAAKNPNAHIYALVDADPHGLDILSVYRYGSNATRYSLDHADLHLGDRIEWLGVKASEWMRLGVRHEELLSLTDKDIQKAQAMLRDRTDMPAAWRRELAHMLHLNKKAEIQILSSTSTASLDAAPVESTGSINAVAEKPLDGLMGCVVNRLRERTLETQTWG